MCIDTLVPFCVMGDSNEFRLYTECWGVLKSILPTFFLL